MTSLHGTVSTDTLNRKIGARIRLKRQSLGKNQTEIGELIGAGRVKVGMIEAGKADISISELLRLSVALEEPFSKFFADLPAEDAEGPEQEPAQRGALEDMLDKDAIELLNAFARIQDASLRRRLIAVVQSYANAIGRKNA